MSPRTSRISISRWCRRPAPSRHELVEQTRDHVVEATHVAGGPVDQHGAFEGAHHQLRRLPRVRSHVDLARVASGIEYAGKPSVVRVEEREQRLTQWLLQRVELSG